MRVRPSSWRSLAERFGFILRKRPRRGRRTDVVLGARQYEPRRLLTSVTVTASDSSAGEGSPTNAGQFVITRSDTTGMLTVNYAISGTATNSSYGGDFDYLSGTVMIGMGQSTATINVNPIDDASVEGSETVILTVSSGSGYTVGTPSSATVTIADNDSLPVVTIAATDSSASEAGPGNGQLTVSRTGSTVSALVVNYALSGTATNSTSGAPNSGDYSYLSGSVTISAGQSTATITVTPVDDASVESTETVIATISSSANYTLGATTEATVNIADNDVLPTVTASATDNAASEAGANTGTITISRTGATTSALTVNYTLSGTAANSTSGSPTSGDYYYLSGSVTIAAGQSSATVTVSPQDDALIEPGETVILTISSSANYTLGETTSATVNLSDNDDPPTVTIEATDNSATESGDTGMLLVTRTGPTTNALTVYYALSGTAANSTSGAPTSGDYGYLGGSVTIGAGQSTATITVTPVDDASVEPSETVIVTLEDGPDVTENGWDHPTYTAGANDSATVNITDNDVLPTVTLEVPDSTAAEAGESTGTFRIRRTGSTAAQITVYYTVTGTATNSSTNGDMTQLNGIATIQAGQETVDITVEPEDDLLVEPSETVIVTIDTNANYERGETYSGQVTITSDDVLPVVSIEATDNAAAEAGQNTATIVVSRTGSTTNQLVVSLDVGGTATSPMGTGSSDYSGLSQNTVTIAAGFASATITLTPVDDSIYEGNETIVIGLQESSNYELGTSTEATATISDDDPPPAPEIALSVGQTGLTDGVSTIDFGTTYVGTPVPVTITVSNTGTANLILDADIELPSGFSLASGPTTTTVTPGGSTQFTVTLIATTVGSYSGTLSLTNDDGDEDPFTVTVQGIVVPLPSEIEIVDRWYQTLADGTGELNFGSTPEGAPLTQTLTIYNWGSGTLTLDAESLELPDGFSLVGSLPTSIAPGAHASFTLRLDADEPGTFEGEFSLENNDANEGVYTFDLTGEVIEEHPEIEVRDESGNSLASATGVVDFGNALTGIPIERTLTIYNWGTASLVLDPEGLTLPEGFSLVTPYASSVLPQGGFTTLVVRLDAETAGAYSGTLSFDTNDVSESPFTLNVRGNVGPVAAWNLHLVEDTGLSGSDRVTSNPTVEANIIGDFSGGSVRVEFDHDGDGEVDGFVNIATTGELFSYDPRDADPSLETFLGELPLRYRSVLLDAEEEVVSTGGWRDFTIELAEDPPLGAAVIEDLGLEFDTGASGTDKVTINPTVVGTVLGDLAGGTVRIEFDHDNDGVAEGFRLVEVSGDSFRYDPRDIDESYCDEAGQRTLGVRAVTLDASGQPIITGAWEEFSFTLVAPPAGTWEVTDFKVADSEEEEGTIVDTLDGLLEGKVSGGEGSPSYVPIQFDHDNDGEPDGQANTGRGDRFFYRPSGLGYGEVTVRARALQWSRELGDYLVGPWESLTFNVTAPAIPDLAELKLETDTGTSATDKITADLTLVGRVDVADEDVDARFRIEFDFNDDGTAEGSARADADGYFRYVPTGLAAGAVTVKARALRYDATAQAELAGDWMTFTFTYQPAAGLAIDEFKLLQDTGTSSTDGVTRDPTVTGKLAGPGSLANVDIEFDIDGDGQVDGYARTNSEGRFAYRPFGLEAGEVTLYARTSRWDAQAGAYVPGNWVSLEFTLEATPNAPPTVEELVLLHDTGASDSDGQTSDATIIGRLENDTTGADQWVEIDLDDDDVADARATLDSNGNFLFRPITVTAGSVTLRARGAEWDPIGQVALVSAWSEVTFTFVEPTNQAPQIASLALLSDSGTSATDGYTANVTIVGLVTDDKQAAGVIVAFDEDGDDLADDVTITDADGKFHYEPAGLDLGEVTIRARTYQWDAVDQVWLIGAWTSLTFNYEDQANTAPSIVALALAHDTGASDTDLETSDSTLEGRIVDDGSLANVTIEFDLDDDDVADTTVLTDRLGQFTLRPQGLAEGSVTIQARARQYDGATRQFLVGSWTSLTFTLESEAAADLPEISSLALANDDGEEDDDGITGDPSLTGQLAGDGPFTGLRIEFDHNGDDLVDGLATVDAEGRFDYLPTDLLVGPLAIRARVARTGANGATESGDWESINFTLDGDAQSALYVSELALAADTGTDDEDGATEDGTLVGQIAGGAAVAGLTVQFDLDGDDEIDGTATTDSQGNFSFTPQEVAEGPGPGAGPRGAGRQWRHADRRLVEPGLRLCRRARRGGGPSDGGRYVGRRCRLAHRTDQLRSAVAGCPRHPTIGAGRGASGISIADDGRGR